jgi:chemotaxis protein MotB
VKPGEEDTKAHELVIIRRRGGGEEGGHHGGVWKIAYADFMTAMMAFFLVMWLINSTDQKVLTQVANYFNPMRLTDSTPHERGLNSVESGEQGKQGKQTSVGDPKEKANPKTKDKIKTKDRTTSDSAPADNGEGVAKGEADEKGEGTGKGDGAQTADGKEAATQAKARFTEQALFSDPYGILARIAAEAAAEAPPATKEGTGSGGELYRDPFDPGVQPTGKRTTAPFAKTKPADPNDPVVPPALGEPPAPAMDSKEIAKKMPSMGPQPAQPAPEAPTVGGEGKKLDEKKLDDRMQGERKQAEGKQDESATPPPEAAPPGEKAPDQVASAEAAKAARQAALEKATQAEAAKIEADIVKVARQLSGTLPNIDVTTNDDGVLISLTDDYDFGMFAIGSAEPRPAMVVIMEKIAKVLQQFQDPLIIRGHTDGRPYRSGSYDNWRLSTARAHMAYYMLVRGGIDDKRFERVEGYADHSLRVPNDAGAAQNRRIEILLRRPKP